MGRRPTEKDGVDMSESGNKSSGHDITRKVGEMIRLGDDVCVRVDKILPDRVLLTVFAPKMMPVHRSEVYAAIGRNYRGERGEGAS